MYQFFERHTYMYKLSRIMQGKIRNLNNATSIKYIEFALKNLSR